MHSTTILPDRNPNSDVKTIIQQGYDTIAPKYLQWSAPRPTTTRTEYLTRLLSLLKPGARVLELGCGAGVPSTQRLVQSGMDVVGVDISAAQIELARKHVQPLTLAQLEGQTQAQGQGQGQAQGQGRARFIQCDMMSLKFDSEEPLFDAVLAFYAIFHLPCEEQGAMIRKMASWARPDGGVVLFNLNGKDTGEVWRGDWMGVRMVSFGLGVEGNKRILKEAAQTCEGLVVEDVVVGEIVGGFEEVFHWVWARREKKERKDGDVVSV